MKSDSELVLIGDDRIASVPIQDNREEFVDLTIDFPELKFDFDRKNVQKLSKNIFLARKSVGQKLVEAQRLLPNGLFLQIKECYRPLWVQKKFWDDYVRHLRVMNSTWNESEISKEASKYLAPIHIAPHATGAAVDLILVNNTSQPIDMGTEFNASPIHTFGASYTLSQNISDLAKIHRQILIDVMTRAGFVNYPTEWWHWSYGDKYWAFCQQQKLSIYAHRKLEYEIKKATRDNIEAIAFINAESWKTTYRGIIDSDFLETLSTEKQLPRAKRLVESEDLDCLVVIEKETSTVIGFACFGKNREINLDADRELQAIYLLEEFQGFGIGQALFNEGVRRIQEKSGRRMIVSVFEANMSARSFYERQGGVYIGYDYVDIAGKRYPTSTYMWEFGSVTATQVYT